MVYSRLSLVGYTAGVPLFSIVYVALGYVFSSLGGRSGLVSVPGPSRGACELGFIADRRLLFGRFPGGPVYSRAGPVYFRVGHANLSSVFPGSLSHLSNVRRCFPRLSWFGPDVISFRVAA